MVANQARQLGLIDERAADPHPSIVVVAAVEAAEYLDSNKIWRTTTHHGLIDLSF